MNKTRLIVAAAGAAMLLNLGGCWDDNEDNTVPPVVVNDVPDSAAVSTASFVSYLLALSGSDDTSEPATLRDSIAVPADDTSEPTPLT